MTARLPLYWDEANSNTAVTRLTEMSSTDLQAIFQNAALNRLSKRVNLFELKTVS